MAKEPVEKNFPLSPERVRRMLEGLPGGRHFITGDMLKPTTIVAETKRKVEVPKYPEEEEMLDPEEMMRELRLLRGRIEDLEMVHYGGLPSSKKDDYSKFKREFVKLQRDFKKLVGRVDDMERSMMGEG
jgi:hypothetical protein